MKEVPFRSARILMLAKGQPCVMCGADDGTVVSAHSNLHEHGKSMASKADDSMIAWLCYRCHAEYDQGKSMSKDERRDFILTAICRTHMKMFKHGMLVIK